MILVDNYFLAILCCVICCACLTALLGAVTLGSMGSEGRTFFQDLAVMDWSSIQYAFLGGVVWNFGNIFLTAAIAVAGMSVGFPIGGGLAWIGGIVFNYLLISLAGQTYQGNQLLLWSGVLVIIVAILICGKAYGKLSSGKASTPKKGILLAIMAGIAIMFFYSLYRCVLLCGRYSGQHTYIQYLCHEASGRRQGGDHERLLCRRCQDPSHRYAGRLYLDGRHGD